MQISSKSYCSVTQKGIPLWSQTLRKTATYITTVLARQLGNYQIIIPWKMWNLCCIMHTCPPNQLQFATVKTKEIISKLNLEMIMII